MPYIKRFNVSRRMRKLWIREYKKPLEQQRSETELLAEVNERIAKEVADANVAADQATKVWVGSLARCERITDAMKACGDFVSEARGAPSGHPARRVLDILRRQLSVMGQHYKDFRKEMDLIEDLRLDFRTSGHG